MASTKLLSIIIPVYNVEKYIGKCLVSIIRQVKIFRSMDEIEIIIVNDGTQDKSMTKVKDFCKNDCIRVINQENKGLSAARNVGLWEATGKYVWFFDSDDYLKENTLCRILKQLYSDLDLYVLGVEHIDEDGNVLYDYLFPKVETTLGLLSDNVFMVQLYIMRRDLLLRNSIHFYEGIMHEDLEFTPRMLSFVQSFVVLDFVSYCYLKRTGSITMGNGVRYNMKRAYDIFKIVDSLDSFRRSLGTAWKKKFSCIISLAMNNILQEEYRFNQQEAKEVGDMFYQNRKFIQHMILSFNPKYMIEGILFALKPKCVVLTFRLLKHRKRHYYE